MEEAEDHGRHPFVSTFPTSSSSNSTSQVQEEVENNELENQDGFRHQQEQGQQGSIVSYRINISLSDATRSELRDDIWSCCAVLVMFCFFASMTLILGFYGSITLQLSPNSSRLIQVSSFFVRSINAEEINEQKPGPMLYGFYGAPPLDFEISWNETHNASLPFDFHKEWMFFLNNDSEVNISYNVISPRSSTLFLVIARGKESLAEWINDPSYPSSILSWNIITGSGEIQQEISTTYDYYIAVANSNYEEVKVQLKFTVKAVIYNISQAHYRCSLSNKLCSLKLRFLGANTAVLTSPAPKEGTLDDYWYVKVSYTPRWLSYFLGSGMMVIITLLAFKFCDIFQPTNGQRGTEIRPEQAPLLLHKDDDVSSRGSSYDSVSHDEEDVEDIFKMNSVEERALKEGENVNLKRQCVICFNASRDCFFLPCGHCAACFSCGRRIAEDHAGTCPICRRKIKKVRKIFEV